MTVLCVDDEEPVLRQTVSLCRELPQVAEVNGFAQAGSALAWVEEHRVDMALLDINMPDMNGLTLAARIREKSPETAIVFATGHSRYAVEAFALHADGYLLKPVSLETLAAEAEHVLSNRWRWRPEHIRVQTFGNFDLFVDGECVAFHRSKSKEILAFLVDRQGSSVTRGEVFSVLYGDMDYSVSMQKQLDVMIRSLRDTLKEYRISEILEMRRGSLRIRPERFTCDLYQFLKGDAAAINAYRGVYMNAYSWASLTEASMTKQREAL